MDNSCLSSVLACMEHNALPPAGFIQQLINSGEAAHETAHKSLFHHAPSLCEALYKHSETKQPIIQWVLGVAKHTLCKEVKELTCEKHGLHFKAKSAMAEQQEGFIMNEIAKTMQEGGPHLWILVTALLDSVPNCHSVQKTSISYTCLFAGQEMDLGEFGGEQIGHEGDKNVEDDSDSECMGQRKCACQAASCNTALIVIVRSNHMILPQKI